MPRHVEIPTDTGLLAASWYDPAPGAAALGIALVLHGWTGSRRGSSASVAATLAELGYACVACDLPGHGDTPGDRNALTRAEFLQAASGSYDNLAARLPVPPGGRALVVGISFGGYLAAQLAAVRRVDALVLRVPADYPDDGFATQPMGDLFGSDEHTLLHDWRSTERRPPDTRATRAIAHAASMPMLVQQAELDTAVPAEQVRAYVQSHAAPELVTHQVISGAPHALTTSPEHLARANRMLADWVTDAST